MKIISDFHDYYDVGIKNGYDPKLPYYRFRREERINYKTEYVYMDYIKRDFEANILYIGFAGKIYPVLIYPITSPQPSYVFDREKIKESFYENAIKRTEPKWRVACYYKSQYKWLKSWMLDYFEKSDKLLNIFKRCRTAIFVYGSNTPLIINERLNQYQFQKILPPMQAYQELEMYVGSYLTQPVMEEPPISDKTKAEIHGFDKFSFRKDKKK